MDSISFPRFVANQSGITGDIEFIHRVRLNPDCIAVAVGFLGEAVKTTTYLIAQLQNEPAILADNSRLITALFGILILHFTLRMHTHEVTRLDHRFDSIFVRYPVRIEHARDSRHRQYIRISLQQSIFYFFCHGFILSTELAAVACKSVMVIHERHSVFAQACS